MFKTFSALAAALALSPAPTAPAPPVPDRAEAVPLRSDPIQRFTVPIEIGRGTYRFMVDTGAERSGIATEIARSLRLGPAATESVTGFAGTSLVPSVALPPVRFAKTRRDDLRALTFPYEAIGADGFLGLDALNGQTVDFDFAGRQMRVRKGSPYIPPWRNAGPIEVASIKQRNGRLIFTEVRANRIRVQALLDTGSSISVGNEALRRELWRRRALQPGIPIHIIAVTGAVVPAEYVVIPDVIIGGARIQNLPVAFSSFELFGKIGMGQKPALVLGMDALRAFDQVTIDFANRQVRFIRAEASESYWRVS